MDLLSLSRMFKKNSSDKTKLMLATICSFPVFPQENPRNRKRRIGEWSSADQPITNGLNGLDESNGYEPASKVQRIGSKVPATITSLPVEILLTIFTYIPTYDLLQNVSRVSKYFYAMTRDPDVHRSVTFTNHVNTDKAIEFLKDKTKVNNSFINFFQSLVGFF